MSKKSEKLALMGPLTSAAAELQTALDRMHGRVLDADELAAKYEITAALNKVEDAVSIIMEEFLPERSERKCPPSK